MSAAGRLGWQVLPEAAPRTPRRAARARRPTGATRPAGGTDRSRRRRSLTAPPADPSDPTFTARHPQPATPLPSTARRPQAPAHHVIHRIPAPRRLAPHRATVVGMTADITLRGPGDVVAILPYQLGYHPHDSVVVISLRGKRVGLVARADLPPEQFVGEVVASLMGPLVRDGATSVIVVGLRGRPRPQPAPAPRPRRAARAGRHRRRRRGRGPRRAPLLADLLRAVLPAGRRRAARPRRRARAWRSTSPWAGRRCGRGPTWRGWSPRSRGGASGSPGPSRREPGCRGAGVGRWPPGALLLDRGERGGRPLDRAVVADLALGLADIPWRDGLIAWLVPTVLPTDKIDPTVLALLRLGPADLGRHGPRGTAASGAAPRRTTTTRSAGARRSCRPSGLDPASRRHRERRCHWA